MNEEISGRCSEVSEFIKKIESAVTKYCPKLKEEKRRGLKNLPIAIPGKE
jgi:hypothetical protein